VIPNVLDRVELRAVGKKGKAPPAGTRQAAARCQPAPSSNIKQNSPAKSAEAWAKNTDIASLSTQGKTREENLPSCGLTATNP
jgi:hypothetical protein